jgi:hypothetical protein
MREELLLNEIELLFQVRKIRSDMFALNKISAL